MGGCQSVPMDRVDVERRGLKLSLYKFLSFCMFPACLFTSPSKVEVR